MSRRDRVGVGLIGLGPSWEQVYREPLLRLHHRLTIRLVYDPVEARARTVANDLEAEVAVSLRQILTRHGLQAVLFLDPGWYREGAWELIAQSGRPVFLGSHVLEYVSAATGSLFEPTALPIAETQRLNLNDQFIPELRLRFTPASCRLRELIATKLGPVDSLRIVYGAVADINQTGAIIDWCSDIMGSSPHGWTSVIDAATNTAQIEFEFPSRPAFDADGRKGHRIVTLVEQVDDTAAIRFEVQCLRGRATLMDRTRIVWRTESESADESLTDERTEIEILVDQFCRRALGGLNPIGRMSDYIRAINLAKSIRSKFR